MTIEEAIESINVPKRATSVIDLNGVDFTGPSEIKIILACVENHITEYDKRLSVFSDSPGYWEDLNIFVYLKAIRNILNAGLLNNGILAGLPKPDLENVSDALYCADQYSEEVLSETEKLVNKNMQRD